MPLGVEIGLSPGDIVLDGDPAPPPQKGETAAPNFWPMYCGQTARWIKMPLGMEVGLGPGDISVDGDLVPPKKGTPQPPMSVVTKRLDALRCHLAWRWALAQATLC